MKHTVRIKKEAPRRLVFEVVSATGALLARSAPFVSICKLEAGLSILTAAARGAESAVVNIDGNNTSVAPAGQRSRVLLEGNLHPEHRRVLFAGITEAVVIDARPPKERRDDLSGPLCGLID